MSELTVEQQRVFGAGAAVDSYLGMPIASGSGALTGNAAAVNNLGSAMFDLARTTNDAADKSKTLKGAQDAHPNLMNAAAAAVATRESKSAREVTPAELDAELQATLHYNHPLLKAMRSSASASQQQAALQAKLNAAASKMIADKVITAQGLNPPVLFKQRTLDFHLMQVLDKGWPIPQLQVTEN
jgi:hypothetical protein